MTNTLRVIIDQLEEDIVFGRRRPRERLVEDDLVAEFGAKKHVIRQALADLEQMGLVERIRNKGATVRDYSPDDVRQIFSVRKLLEAEAVRQIALPADPELIDALEDVFAQHSEAVADADLQRAFHTNIQFHQILFSACGNPYLTEAIKQFALKAHAIRSYSLGDAETLRNARDDHRHMIDALRAGDRDALVDTCVRHLEPAQKVYISAYENFFGPKRQRAN